MPTVHSYAVTFTTFLLCFLTLGTASGNAAVYYNYWLDYFHDLKSTTSLIGSVNIGLLLSLGPVASYLANRYGHRTVVCAGAVLSSAGMVAGSMAPSIAVLLATHVVTGIGWCMAFVPGAMAASYYWEPKYHGFVFGLTICGVGVGSFASSLLVVALSETYTWRGALLVQGGLNLNLLACGAILYPLPEMKKSSNFLELSLLRDSYFANTLVYWLIQNLGISVMRLNLAYVVKMALNTTNQKSAWVVATFSLTSAFARVLYGFISRVPRINAMLVQLLSTTVIAIVLICMPHVRTYSLMIGLAVVLGFGFGAFALNALMIVEIVGLKSRTAGFGFFTMAAGIGFVSGAPIAGLLSDMTDGSNTISMYFGGGMILLANVLQLRPVIRWSYIRQRQLQVIPVPTQEQVAEEEKDENQDAVSEYEMAIVPQV